MPSSIVSHGFLGLTQLSKKLMPSLWGWLYNEMAARDTSNQFMFMNYGYVPEFIDQQLFLTPDDEPFRTPIQLYVHTLQNINLLDKDILEVGCGRGGGGSYLKRTHQLRSFTGIDLSAKAIDRCIQTHTLPQTFWKQGAADALPVADSSIDIVINIESSHCYPSMENFLNEIVRVLRPKGYFAWCDLRGKESMATVIQQFKNSQLTLIQHHNINTQVLNSLDKLSGDREKCIIANVPRWIRPAFRDFIGVKNSALYNKLKEGSMVYKSALLQKT
ncbi:MAG: class I SAM-dependent methyltransferase [Pseudomonadota bacterium]